MIKTILANLKTYSTKYKKDFLVTYLTGAVFFLILYIFTAENYTATIRILPNIDRNVPQNINALASLAQNLGFGSYKSGSIQKIIPEVLKSRFVLKKIVESTYTLTNDSNKINIYQFFSYPESEKSYQILSYELLKNNIQVSEDINTEIIEIKITTSDPLLSSQIGENIINYTNLYFSSKYVSEASLKSKILYKRREEILKKLNDSKQAFIEFVEKNQTYSSSTLEFKHEFLKGELDRILNIYNQISAQYELNNIEVLGETPILNILESPIPPVFPSNKRKINYILVFLALTSIILFIDIFIKEAYTSR